MVVYMVKSGIANRQTAPIPFARVEAESSSCWRIRLKLVLLWFYVLLLCYKQTLLPTLNGSKSVPLERAPNR